MNTLHVTRTNYDLNGETTPNPSVGNYKSVFKTSKNWTLSDLQLGFCIPSLIHVNCATILIDRYMILRFFTYPTCPTSLVQNFTMILQIVLWSYIYIYIYLVFIFLYITNNVRNFNMNNLTNTNSFLKSQENSYRKNEPMLQNHKKVLYKDKWNVRCLLYVRWCMKTKER